MNLEDIVNKVDRIDGWFLGSQQGFLYPYVQSLEPKSMIVEIGTYRGRSTMFLALAAPESYIITIDPCNYEWGREMDKKGFKLINEPIENDVLKSGKVVQIISTSQEVAKTFNFPIDFLFIDGLHEQTELDIELWTPFVKKGGLIAFHDYDVDHKEVLIPVNKLISTGNYRMLKVRDYMCVVEKI